MTAIIDVYENHDHDDDTNITASLAPPTAPSVAKMLDDDGD